MMLIKELYILAVFLVAALVSLMVHGKKESELLELDLSVCMKGLSAVMVAIGHCVGGTDNWLLNSLNVGWYCVSSFFFWSGYGVAYGYQNLSLIHI